jgi:hypothetical protein
MLLVLCNPYVEIRSDTGIKDSMPGIGQQIDVATTSHRKSLVAGS